MNTIFIPLGYHCNITILSQELNINTEAIKNLKVLTDYHKKMAQKLCKKNIKTMEDWITFIKRVSRFAF